MTPKNWRLSREEIHLEKISSVITIRIHARRVNKHTWRRSAVSEAHTHAEGMSENINETKKEQLMKQKKLERRVF